MDTTQIGVAVFSLLAGAVGYAWKKIHDHDKRIALLEQDKEHNKELRDELKKRVETITTLLK